MSPLAAIVVLVLMAPPAIGQDLPLEPIGLQARLASQGPAGSPEFDAQEPDIAYNSAHDEFLVVWSGQDERWPDEIGIYGQRLDGHGRPVGDVLRLSVLGAVRPDADFPVAAAGHPAVAYDSDRDRYAVVFQYADFFGSHIGFQLLTWDGTLKRFIPGLGEPPDPTSSDFNWAYATDFKHEPDIAYNAASETYLVVWRGQEGGVDPNARPAGDVHAIFGLTLTGDGDPADPMGGTATLLSRSCPTLSDAPEPSALCQQAFEPAVVAQNGSSASLVVWVQAASLGDPGKIWGVHHQLAERGVYPPGPLAGDGARAPTLSSAGDRALLTYTERADGARAVHAAVVRSAPNFLFAEGPDRRVNGGVRVGGESSAVAYLARHNAFLVAWNGTDDGTAAVPEGEREVTGQIVDLRGREVGRDDFLISDMGVPGSPMAGTGSDPPVVAANPTTGEWMVAWAGQENRPPFAGGKFEMWGRRVGPNTDRDYDGTPVPADCQDLDPAVHPGAVDMPFNGVDEDCSGADSRDRDGDGAEPPADCDDRNRFIRPGRREIPGNAVDENCDGRYDHVRSTARVRAAWLFGPASTAPVRLHVEGARRGMRVWVRCLGTGCPARLRGAGRAVAVRRRGVVRLTGMLAGAHLLPGGVVEVRVVDPGAIGVLERFLIRAGRPPRNITGCLSPGQRKTVRCPR